MDRAAGAVTREAFRKVMGLFATGVTVVTFRQRSGQPWGFTVNSFTSVSLSPPLVLFCVDHGAESFAVMQDAEYFAVNVLSEAQEEISQRFASKTSSRFEGLEYREGLHSLPLFANCLGSIQCAKTASHPHGDHTVVIGEVLEATAAGGEPLLFYRSSYARIGTRLGSGARSGSPPEG